MKKFEVRWKLEGTTRVEADTRQEAIDRFHDKHLQMIIMDGWDRPEVKSCVKEK